MIEDAALLRRYATEKSEEAFAELVRRHLNLVYSVALRQVAGDAHLAEDVAQQVFTALARKAAALAERPALSGWLYRSAHFAASDVVRVERRRRAREQEVHLMNSLLTDPASPADWDRVRPTLDAAIAELDERDRDAVSLRFFNGCSFAEIGVRLRLTENTARMRVERALDKLHASLARRGVTSTTGALSVALAGQAAASAPAGVAASVTGAALAGATAGGGAGAWLASLTMNKIKTGLTIAFLAALTIPVIVQLQTNRALSAELAAARTENDSLVRSPPSLASVNQQPHAGSGDVDELTRLRARIALLKARPAGVTDSSMKPPAAWQNRGQATSSATYETQLWAASVRDMDVYARTYGYSAESKAKMAAFFASLNPAVQARCGTLERYFAERWFELSEPDRSQLAAFQVLGEHAELKNGGGQVALQIWVRTPTGEEHASGGLFARVDGSDWKFVSSALPDSFWSQLFAQIDPATGEFLPGGADRFRSAMRKGP